MLLYYHPGIGKAIYLIVFHAFRENIGGVVPWVDELAAA